MMHCDKVTILKISIHKMFTNIGPSSKTSDFQTLICILQLRLFVTSVMRVKFWDLFVLQKGLRNKFPA